MWSNGQEEFHPVSSKEIARLQTCFQNATLATPVLKQPAFLNLRCSQTSSENFTRAVDSLPRVAGGGGRTVHRHKIF